MQLPRGATGFWSSSATPPVPVDVRTFKSLGYSVGPVVSFRPADVTPNFHLLTLRLPTGDIGAICHELLPLIAFVAVPVVDCSLTFVSRPDPAPSFPGFEVLTADALDTPVSRADLSLLDAAEQRQIRRFQPWGRTRRRSRGRTCSSRSSLGPVLRVRVGYLSRIHCGLSNLAFHHIRRGSTSSRTPPPRALCRALAETVRTIPPRPM